MRGLMFSIIVVLSGCSAAAQHRRVASRQGIKGPGVAWSGTHRLPGEDLVTFFRHANEIGNGPKGEAVPSTGIGRVSIAAALASGEFYSEEMTDLDKIRALGDLVLWLLEPLSLPAAPNLHPTGMR